MFENRAFQILVAAIALSAVPLPLASAETIPTMSASATAMAHGGCSLECSFTYTAEGTASGPAVQGTLFYTNSPPALCSGATLCKAYTRDPITYDAAICHVATMQANGLLPGTEAVSNVHCV